MIMQIMIFEREDKGVSIVSPSQSAMLSLSIEEIATRVVPHGLPYWIVDSADIPTDRSQRDAWEIDETVMGDPDGFGGESNELTNEQFLAFRRAENV